ncbi:hypothetical protein HPB47_023919 [Ixodes persulcatus]|uniref:Uncharacterized protein n=1 Tax=Ixodes persulcatus TaxID=34615 RepID=A0AC60Q5P1_IXOPE|nr:hypothetical protein HPB47_023919 [Ixodes persulcatus]
MSCECESTHAALRSLLESVEYNALTLGVERWSRCLADTQRHREKATPDKAKPDVPNVACGSCEQWCFLTETPYASVEEAAGKEYQCRICVNANEMKGMEMIRGELGKERETRERMEVEMEMKEAREGLRDEKGEIKGGRKALRERNPVRSEAKGL